MTKKNRVNSAAFFNAKITSVISITLVLLLLGITILTLFVGKGISSYVKENMSFNVVLCDDISTDQIATFRKRVDAQPFVKSSRLISKEEAKEQLTNDLGDDPEALLGYNPASDCVEIFLKSEYANNDSIPMIEKAIKKESTVQDLLYRQEALDLINNNLSKVTMILLILSGVLLIISFTLIRNTIRLSIYSKRFLIHTMRLVGATNKFIRKPFIIRNIVDGIVAALIACSIIWGMLYYFGLQYVDIFTVISLSELAVIFGIVVILGIVISFLATLFAVNRYLRMKTDTLFYV